MLSVAARTEIDNHRIRLAIGFVIIAQFPPRTPRFRPNDGTWLGWKGAIVHIRADRNSFSVSAFSERVASTV